MEHQTSCRAGPFELWAADILDRLTGCLAGWPMVNLDMVREPPLEALHRAVISEARLAPAQFADEKQLHHDSGQTLGTAAGKLRASWSGRWCGTALVAGAVSIPEAHSVQQAMTAEATA